MLKSKYKNKINSIKKLMGKRQKTKDEEFLNEYFSNIGACKIIETVIYKICFLALIFCLTTIITTTLALIFISQQDRIIQNIIWWIVVSVVVSIVLFIIWKDFNNQNNIDDEITLLDATFDNKNYKQPSKQLEILNLIKYVTKNKTKHLHLFTNTLFVVFASIGCSFLVQYFINVFEDASTFDISQYYAIFASFLIAASATVATFDTYPIYGYIYKGQFVVNTYNYWKLKQENNKFSNSIKE